MNRVLGTRGRQTRFLELGGTVWIDRRYTTCGFLGGFVQVSFTNGRMATKLAFWG